MQSRGFALIAAQTRNGLVVSRAGSRYISTRLQRPQIPRHAPSHLNFVSRRNLSLNPSSWLPSQIIPQPHDLSVRSAAGAPASTSHTSPTPTSAPSSGPDAMPSGPGNVEPPSTVADLGSLDFSTIENVGDVYTQMIPEQIGFLKTLGLDYGYGITSMIQWSLEHVHIYTGLPWWASITLTALASRVILFWAAVKSSDVMARMTALKPITQPITDKMMEAYKTQNTAMVQQAQTEMRDVMKRADIKYSRMMIPLAAQSVIAFSALKLTRAMAALPVPGLRTGGTLWFQDLTIADPTYMLPVIMAVTLHFFFRYGGESGAALDMKPAMRSAMLYIAPALVFGTMAWLPSVVVLWLATTGILGILQARFLQQPTVREYLGIAPLLVRPQDVKVTAPKIEKIIDVSALKNEPPVSTAGKAPPSPADISKQMKWQAPKLSYAPTTREETASPAESTRGPSSAAGPASEGILSQPKEFLTTKANEFGDAWESLKDTVKTRVAAKQAEHNNTSESRNLSKRQIEDADQYEREYQARKKRQPKI